MTGRFGALHLIAEQILQICSTPQYGSELSKTASCTTVKAHLSQLVSSEAKSTLYPAPRIRSLRFLAKSGLKATTRTVPPPTDAETIGLPGIRLSLVENEGPIRS